VDVNGGTAHNQGDIAFHPISQVSLGGIDFKMEMVACPVTTSLSVAETFNAAAGSPQ
jgi:hypothetical protein